MKKIEKFNIAVEIVDDELICYDCDTETKEILYDTIGVLQKVNTSYAEEICDALNISLGELSALGVTIYDIEIDMTE